MTTDNLIRKWSDRGVKAGKTEGWMNLEETLAEDLARHPTTDYSELVQQSIESWEETTHFATLYGSRMWDDARDDDGSLGEKGIDRYQDYESEFWEGYLEGRLSIGKDIYALAKKLIAKKGKTVKYAARQSKSKKHSSASSLGTAR